jgi:hypothetical protein
MTPLRCQHDKFTGEQSTNITLPKLLQDGKGRIGVPGRILFEGFRRSTARRKAALRVLPDRANRSSGVVV